MSAGLFVAWIVVMALALTAYAAVAALVLASSDVPRRWKWSVLVPPVACWVAMRAGGWARAASVVFLVLSAGYGALRLVPRFVGHEPASRVVAR